MSITAAGFKRTREKYETLSGEGVVLEFTSPRREVVTISKEVFQSKCTPETTRIVSKLTHIVASSEDYERYETAVIAARRILVDVVPELDERVSEVKDETTGTRCDIVRSALNPNPLVVPQIAISRGSSKTFYLGISSDGVWAALKENSNLFGYESFESCGPIRGSSLIRESLPCAVLPSALFASTGYWGQVSRFCERGSWTQFFLALDIKEKQKWLKIFIQDTAQGLDQFHSKGLVYADLKPDNLVVSELESLASTSSEVKSSSSSQDKKPEESESKLISRFIDLDSVFEASVSGCVLKQRTLKYLPPQYRREKLLKWNEVEAKYSPQKDDIWALGISAFKILTGNIPIIIRDMTRDYELPDLLQGIWDKKEEFKAAVEKELLDLDIESALACQIQAMLEVEGDKRPSADFFISK